ncbi:nSTAND1 domain-containing NTPase [Paraburkholderia strydomiana]|uniref:Novel STAND NTPase 1 domain-containing protein n=1 Tax=Paraburkholderia strydomiana TaxID=1245417 RepID=A0ABW9BYC7_9BURK
MLRLSGFSDIGEMMMETSSTAFLAEATESPSNPESTEWPVLPYKGLNYYTASDTALFCERDEEIQDCGTIIGNFGTKMLLVHGRTGAGKSSFLRAGLFPRLMDNRLFYCMRCVENTEPALIRSTGDPIASIMDVLHDRLGDTEAFPGVKSQTRRTARSMLECRPGATGAERAQSLLHTLHALTAQICGTLILAIDQAEEVFTLASDQTIEVRKAYFDLLDSLCYDRFDIKLILALRTEYYGHFADSFRISPNTKLSAVDSGLEQFMLHGISSPEQLTAVILRPTLMTLPPRTEKAPHELYNFTFEQGLVPTIVDDVLRHCGESSTLPILQLVCLDLYADMREKEEAAARGGRDAQAQGEAVTARTIAAKKEESIIRSEAYVTRGGVQGAIDRYFKRAIAVAMGKSVKTHERHLNAWRDVLSLLVAMQEGGALNSLLLPESLLADEARKFDAPEPIEETLAAMATPNLRLLRKVDLRDAATGEHTIHYSLGHDALAIPLHEWKKAQKARLGIKAARKRLLLLAGGLTGATAFLAGLAVLAGYAAYSAKIAAVEAILQGVETEPDLGSRILLLTAIEKNAGWLDHHYLPMKKVEDKLRSTLSRSPFFSASAACAGFNGRGDQVALANEDGATQSLNLQALADHEESQSGKANVDAQASRSDPQKQCFVGFVANLTSPVFLLNDTLAYNAHNRIEKTSLKSLQKNLPDSRSRFADFGSGLLRLTGWMPQPDRTFTQTFYDFRYDQALARFVPVIEPAPKINVTSRYGIVFSESTQRFAYTESVDDQSRSVSASTSEAETAAGQKRDSANTDDEKNVQLIVRTREKPEENDYTVREARAVYNDPNVLIPWSIAFLPGDDGSLVYRNKTRRFVFVKPTRGTSSATISEYTIAESNFNLRPVPSQFSWGRPLLAGVSMMNQYRVAWMTVDGITVFQSNDAHELKPLYKSATLLPALSDADIFSRIRFSRDGDTLLFARHQFNRVVVYAWDLRSRRPMEIAGYDPKSLVDNACLVATNIGRPTLSDKDLVRLPKALRAQPCSS